MTVEKAVPAQAKSGQYLSFCLNNQFYALPIWSVIEINQMSDITPIPEAPSFVKGVLNLRGRIIPVVDLRVKFGMEATSYTKKTCIIVFEAQGGLAGMIVDSVREVMDFDGDSIEVSPQLGSSEAKEYISGIGKREEEVIVLLDIEKVFMADNLVHYQKEELQPTG